MQENRDSYHSNDTGEGGEPIVAQVLDIHALADDQLDLEQKADAMKKLSENPVSFREYLTVIKLKAVLQKHCGSVKNEEAWEDVSQNIQKVVRRKQYKAMANRFLWVAAAGFLGFIVGMQVYHSDKAGGVLDISGMPTAMSSLVPISVGSLRSPVKMESVVPNIFGTSHAPIRTDSQLFGVNGIDTGIMSGRRVFRFNVQDERGPLMLLVVEGIDRVRGNIETDKKFTYWEVSKQPYIGWNHAQYMIMLTANRSREELRNIASRLVIE